MKRRAQTEIVIFILLVAAGVAVRLLCQDLPNFAPVAALALFSGFFFRRRTVALLVPLSVMAISDPFIGGYNLWLTAIVYAALAAPVAARDILRRYLRIERGRPAATAVAVAGLLGCGIGSSLLFFLVSNAGHWMMYDMYEHTFGGLVQCYIMALPFFRFTLVGDVLFAALLFGSYTLAVTLGYETQDEPRVSTEKVL